MRLNELQSALTHGGKFHADDVFSTALLKLYNPQLKVTRAFSVPEGFEGIVYDVGLGEFDHHQKGAPVRDNGVPYAAFGLIWRAFGAQVLGEEEARRFDEHFVQPLDLDDNTGCGHPIASLIGNFNPGWDSDEDTDACFFQAVEFAMGILERRFADIQGIGRARLLVEDALSRQQDGIVILPRFAPWKSVLADSPAKFVIYPSKRGGFSAQAVPFPREPEELKCPFPQAWRGKPQEELPKITGIAGLRFCHNSGFLIAAQTQEDAIAACRLAMQLVPQQPEAEPQDRSDGSIRPGHYRHFKGGDYEVLFTANHSETLEELVVYRALYGERGVWVRPCAMFRESVMQNGERVPRFTYLGD